MSNNYLFNYFSVTPFCNLLTQGIRGLQTVCVGRLLKLLFLRLPPYPSATVPPRPFHKIPPRCRVPQVFPSSEIVKRPPASAVLRGLQVRRKNDPFRPQARWGDDGARRVVMHVTAPLWHACTRFVARQFPTLPAARWVPSAQPTKPVFIGPRSRAGLP